MSIKITTAIFFAFIVLSNGYQDVQKLYEDMFEKSDYKSVIPPITSDGDSVKVELAMYMFKLVEINTKQQYISVSGWLAVKWIDHRLKWNSTEYGGLDTIVVPVGDVWVPSFILSNSASGDLYNEFWYSLYKVTIANDGRISWTPGGIFTADCEIDVSNFPFDEQVCGFTFENWAYSGNVVNLTYSSGAENKFLEFSTGRNGQWDINRVGVSRGEKKYTTKNAWPRVHFAMQVERKSLFYVVNFILLSLLLSLLVLSLFKLPAGSGERISMGVTLLLSFSVFVLIISDSIPETSTAVPVLIICFIFFMILTSLAICETVFVLWCYHHDGEHPVPRWLKWFFNDAMAKVFKFPAKLKCIKSSNDNVEESRKESTCSSGADEEAKDFCVQQWQQISRQMDIFCFWLFLVLFFIAIIIFLILIPKSSNHKDIEKYFRGHETLINYQQSIS